MWVTQKRTKPFRRQRTEFWTQFSRVAPPETAALNHPIKMKKKSERATAAHFASPQSWNSTLHAEIFCTVWMRKDRSLRRFTFWWAILQPYLLVIRRSEYQEQCEQQKLNGCPLDGSAFLAEKIECEDAKRIASPPPCILRLWNKSCA